jgi:RNA polymerase sigma-70 factor (ECF subfamily)
VGEHRASRRADEHERRLVAALRGGDERAFAELVETYSPALLALARTCVPTAALTEEVVQETWLGVLVGIDRFEGRSSLKTWIFRILVNVARTRGTQERRMIPFSSAVSEAEAAETIIEPERFLGPGHRYAGHWALGPARWNTPDDELLRGETRIALVRAIDALPPAQRQVLTLRDIRGFASSEVCDALAISPGNQRVLLHRARTKVRKALEDEFHATAPTLEPDGSPAPVR